MRVLICNERFLFRFGADRVLIILGHGLKKLGHGVAVMANRFDKEIVASFTDKIIEVPTAPCSYAQLNEYTAQWLEDSWPKLFTTETEPDIVLIGGWPFISCIPFFRKIGKAAVFLDYGIVPVDGYRGKQLVLLNKLRALRKEFLPQASAVIGGSKFIIDSQSVPDTSGKIPIFSVLAGADHMEMNLWTAEKVFNDSTDRGSALEALKRLQDKGRPVILNLGRWEPGCYKNSEAAFEFAGQLQQFVPVFNMLILADPVETVVPAELLEIVIPIGFPDDTELQEIMSRVDLGISVSLWEGFNLPLAEMQWLGKPVLVFNIGAHPEVVADPWSLCAGPNEMVDKAAAVLNGVQPGPAGSKEKLDKWRQAFRWQTTVRKYHNIFQSLVNPEGSIPENVVVDVTNATRDPANSGVIRVTRRLCRSLQDYVKPIFVVWDPESKSYVFPNQAQYDQLSQFNGPVIPADAPRSSHGGIALGSEHLSGTTWLLLTETVNENNASFIRRWARASGLSLAAIFYDAIPVLRPELCKDIAIRDNHANYMLGLAECDLVMPISEFSGECLKHFWSEKNVEGCTVTPILLPGELAGERNLQPQILPKTRIKILCVSTLEPRKNHESLIKACLLLLGSHPELDWSLTLVGNRYAGGDDIVEFVKASCRNCNRIRWEGIVDDETLHRLYQECSFTVYPSVIEGFGLPILESIWYGKPCICHEKGVMSEIAAEGGCLTADVTDIGLLSESIFRLATDSEVYSNLSRQAVTRSIKTWDDYAKQFIKVIQDYKPERISLRENHLDNSFAAPLPDHSLSEQWDDIIYRGCLLNNWQMNDSERLALDAVLRRIRPACCIEIGTFKGGSLSLIAQHCPAVFSIDIDPSVPERLPSFPNVSFIIGPSAIVLPALLDELTKADLPVDFVLIDGDHSRAGVKRDSEIMLSYVPKKPLFMLIHDSFNPGCRAGILSVNWELSPYVHKVDLDFIPGRLIEHGGGGDSELWGGFAMVFMSPLRRSGALTVDQSAQRVFGILTHPSSSAHGK